MDQQGIWIRMLWTLYYKWTSHHQEELITRKGLDGRVTSISEVKISIGKRSGLGCRIGTSLSYYLHEPLEAKWRACSHVQSVGFLSAEISEVDTFLEQHGSADMQIEGWSVPMTQANHAM